MRMIDPEGLQLARARGTRWSQLLGEWQSHAQEPAPVPEGRLVRATGLTLEAAGCAAPIGTRCMVRGADGRSLETEVVGFADERLYLMPTDRLVGVAPSARVTPLMTGARLPVGDALLGRVVDALGRPLDARGPLRCRATTSLDGEMINPLARRPIREPFDVGVRALNALLTAGRGQRLGLFAGSGVGKSSLLAMMTRYCQADVIVVGLIGERGREVREFVEDNLGAEALGRAVVVATPADAPALMRMHGAWYATSIAEHFRDRGMHVLFLMDSLTRFAQAQREIGLAIGEPPATKGYPPSVFARLPQLIERTGNGHGERGSITAFYTVLIEGDDRNDPIVDSARAILDGHVMLSREIADTGRYPPIDIEGSVSRAMQRLASPDHLHAAQRFRDMYTYYTRHRDLLTVGAYAQGSDPKLDTAVRMWPRMEAFLRQGLHEPESLQSSIQALQRIVRDMDAEPTKERSDKALTRKD
jgi:flagellum-specific ATP synthase